MKMKMKMKILALALLPSLIYATNYNALIGKSNYTIAPAEVVEDNSPNGNVAPPDNYEAKQGTIWSPVSNIFDNDLAVYGDIISTGFCDIEFSYNEAIALHTLNLLNYNSRYGFDNFNFSGSNTVSATKVWEHISFVEVTNTIEIPSDFNVTPVLADYDIIYDLENTENKKYLFYKIVGPTGGHSIGVDAGCIINEMTFKS